MDPRRRALVAALAAAAAAGPALAQKRMTTKPIPSTGEALPVIGLGTWQTFDVGSDATARASSRQVLKLLDKNVVDSSPMYGPSETVAGDLIAELGMRAKVFMATKVWTTGREEGIRQMETSLKR